MGCMGPALTPTRWFRRSIPVAVLLLVIGIGAAQVNSVPGAYGPTRSRAPLDQAAGIEEAAPATHIPVPVVSGWVLGPNGLPVPGARVAWRGPMPTLTEVREEGVVVTDGLGVYRVEPRRSGRVVLMAGANSHCSVPRESYAFPDDDALPTNLLLERSLGVFGRVIGTDDMRLRLQVGVRRVKTGATNRQRQDARILRSALGAAATKRGAPSSVNVSPSGLFRLPSAPFGNAYRLTLSGYVDGAIVHASTRAVLDLQLSRGPATFDFSSLARVAFTLRKADLPHLKLDAPRGGKYYGDSYPVRDRFGTYEAWVLPNTEYAVRIGSEGGRHAGRHAQVSGPPGSRVRRVIRPVRRGLSLSISGPDEEPCDEVMLLGYPVATEREGTPLELYNSQTRRPALLRRAWRTGTRGPFDIQGLPTGPLLLRIIPATVKIHSFEPGPYAATTRLVNVREHGWTDLDLRLEPSGSLCITTTLKRAKRVDIRVRFRRRIGGAWIRPHVVLPEAFHGPGQIKDSIGGQCMGGLPPGDYELEWHRVGGKPMRQEFVIRQGEQTTVTLDLEK